MLILVDLNCLWLVDRFFSFGLSVYYFVVDVRYGLLAFGLGLDDFADSLAFLLGFDWLDFDVVVVLEVYVSGWDCVAFDVFGLWVVLYFGDGHLSVLFSLDEGLLGLRLVDLFLGYLIRLLRLFFVLPSGFERLSGAVEGDYGVVSLGDYGDELWVSVLYDAGYPLLGLLGLVRFFAIVSGDDEVIEVGGTVGVGAGVVFFADYLVGVEYFGAFGVDAFDGIWVSVMVDASWGIRRLRCWGEADA